MPLLSPQGLASLLEAMSQLGSVRHVDLTKLMELFPDIATMQREHDQNHATCNGIFTFSNERFLCGGSVFEMRMTCDCEPSLCEEKFLSVGERVEDAAAKSKQVFTSNALAVLNCIASGGTLQNLNQLLAGMGHPPMHDDVWEREDGLWHDIAVKVLEQECDRNILLEAAASRSAGIFVYDKNNKRQIALEFSTDGEHG